MQLAENWYVNAPWAQLVCSTKVPDDIFKTVIDLTDKIYDDVNHDSAGAGLAGQIQQEYFITQEKLMKTGLMEYFIAMTTKYWETMLSNGNMWEYLDQNYPNGPHGHNWACRVVSAWTVHQFENEYNPIHKHSNCKVSAVMHIKFPEKIEEPVKPHLKGLDGNLIFAGMGDQDQWNTAPILNIRGANVGWLHLFPSSLGHAVYPFKGKGERRSLSFNVDVISKKEMDIIAEQEKLKNKG